jgi:D-galactarolactone cycloisomerase
MCDAKDKLGICMKNLSTTETGAPNLSEPFGSKDRIKKISTHILRVPLGKNRFYSSQSEFPERNSMLVRIETDDGIVGWGEGGQYGPPEPVATCVTEVLAPRILGRSPFEYGRIWEELYAFSRDFGQKGVYIEAMSAIDIALWDITGKARGVPVHQLLGGAFRESVPSYATGCYYRGEDAFDYKANLDALVQEAVSFSDAGFQLLKMKVGLLSIAEDTCRLAAIRKAVGPEMILMVDANHAYSAPDAIRMGRALEQQGVVFFEEPVVPEDRDGYRRVRGALDLAIAGGECEYTRYGFRDLIAGGCVDVAQPDVCVCGGLSEAQKILALASSYGVKVIPHVWGSGVAFAAGLHFVASLPPMPHTARPVPLQNEPVIEYDRNPNPLREDLCQTRISLRDGRVVVPNTPGLGIDINMDVLHRYSS